jgi:TonB family protein
MGGCENLKPPTIGDHGPIIKNEIRPLYPKELLNAGITGSVTITFMVESNGLVDQVHIIESSHPLFAQATLQAVTEWKYWPGISQGKPTRTLIRRTIHFDRNSFDELK